jgi:multiple sugar transport system substrate-binding protein
MKVRFGLGALLACLIVVVAACGSDSGSSGGGSAKKITGAKVIDIKAMTKPPKGTIKYCQGKDTTGSGKEVVADFNKKFGSQGYKATLTEFPASADQQRAQFIQRQQAKSDDCDVFSSDVIWTAEFASQKWLYDLTPYINQAKDKYIGAPLETVHYGGKYWGVPETSDAAFIYYKGDKAPATWQEVYADAKKSGGLVYQGAPYEGLTCNYLELAFAAGGTVISARSRRSTRRRTSRP